MAKKRAFISFDYDYDGRLKDFLVGQARHSDSPFELADWSIKSAVPGRWQDDARRRISAANVVIVICGRHTDAATSVNAELKIAQEEGIPYFLLNGYSGETGVKPRSAKTTDKVYRWTWDNLKALIGGAR